MPHLTAATDTETKDLFITSGAMFLGLIGVFVFSAPGGLIGAVTGAVAGAVLDQIHRH